MIWSGDTKSPSDGSADIVVPDLLGFYALFPALLRLANMRADICRGKHRGKHLGRSAGSLQGSMENEGKSPAKDRGETESKFRSE